LTCAINAPANDKTAHNDRAAPMTLAYCAARVDTCDASLSAALQVSRATAAVFSCGKRNESYSRAGGRWCDVFRGAGPPDSSESVGA
jgi:hypothetical protein